MTTQATQTRSKSVQQVGGGTPMTEICTVVASKLRNRLFLLGMPLLGSLVLTEPLWAQSEVSFISQDFRAGDNPSSVAVGDFNGDSQQDLVTGDRGGSVFVLLGRGDGTFEPAQDFAGRADPSLVIVGDFNGDGRQDLAAADRIDSVAILLGRGDGTFEPAQNFAVGGDPLSVTVGDFNGDGRQDLATASSSANAVSILLGRGDGTFEPAQDFAAGFFPGSITVGDFNGDGQQDLATVGAADTVFILLGQGDGTFEPPQDLGVGRNPASITVGDFNGDSRQDLATANVFGGASSGGTVSILLGRGDGTFEPAQDFAAEPQARSVTVGDFNRDGRQDLATANLSDDTASILLGRGDGAFDPAQHFGVGALPISIIMGDFNGDGQQDLATANAGGGTVSILINNAAVEIAVTIDIKPGTFPNSINPKSNGVIPVAVLTTDTFEASAVDTSTVLFGAVGSDAAPVHSALKDIDGDGDTDMILHFRTQNTGIACGDTSASLRGRTFSGQAIEGSDSIRTVGCKQRSCVLAPTRSDSYPIR